MKPQPTLLGSRQFFLQALRAFLDLHYLVGDVAVRFAVDGFGASALGASNRQKTSPLSSLNQYLRAFASWFSWASRSFLWSSRPRLRP